MWDKFEEKTDIQMRKKIQEKAILSQIAILLTQEKLIDPEEQMRFLACLKEED